jgi:predicted ATPase/class 3 adenylate cyclase
MLKRPLPSGTVTFLFTDIEGSTRAWEQHPDAMAVALADHDRLLRGVFERHGGYVFKTVGDEFCCAFQRSRDALTAAIEAMRALQVQRWPDEIGEVRVRMALHCGDAIAHDGDYFGPTLNRVARLLAIGYGGQILLTAAAAQMLEGTPLEGVVLRDLGSHRLRDLRQAEPTFQAMAEGLRASFPALASVDAHPNNLPSQISSFVGREPEIANLRRGLTEYRVVTVGGAGGIGKTRLALQVAAEVVQEYSGGVYLVALAPLPDGRHVPNALASALGVVEVSNEALEETIVRHLGSKHVLLIFDNCEHVLGETALLVKRILSECPNVRCLITSREPLHLTGECVERLAPLSTPDGSFLFLERARAVAGTLALSETECELVVEICRRLDGIPLAIELAASRLATIPLERLAKRLQTMLLASKDATVDERHRTLRAAIAWSYDLLADSEKRTFSALSLFAGGCTIEALEHVVEAEVDVEIESLVDKSLVQLDLRESAESRYRLLEPVAEFAIGELAALGESDALRRRHIEFYSTLASSVVAADASARAAGMSRIDVEIGNMRAALERAMDADVERAAALIIDLTHFWRARGSFTEGRDWLERLLARAAALDLTKKARALRNLAAFAAMQDDYDDASRLARDAVEIYRSLSDDSGIGSALHIVAEVAHRQGHLEQAKRLYTESYEHLDAANHLVGKTICMMNLGMLARDDDEDYESSEKLLRKASEDAQRLGYPSVMAQVEIERAWTALCLGDSELAERYFREAFGIKTSERDLHGACQARLGVASALLVAGRADAARHEFETALAEATALKAQIFVINAIHGIAGVAAIGGDLVAAAKCCGFADKLIAETHCSEHLGLVQKIVTERIYAGLSAEEIAAAAATGAAMKPQEVAALFGSSAAASVAKP